MCLSAIQIDYFCGCFYSQIFWQREAATKKTPAWGCKGSFSTSCPSFLIIIDYSKQAQIDTLSITDLEQLQDRSPWHWTFPYHVLAKGKRQETSLSIKIWLYIPARKLSHHPVKCGPRNHKLRVVSNFAARRRSTSRVSRVCVYFACQVGACSFYLVVQVSKVHRIGSF